MLIPIYRTTDEAVIDDDERLMELSQFRWCASYAKGQYCHRRFGIAQREYFYVTRNFSQDGKKRHESLQRAVLRLLGEPIPPGHRVWFKNDNRLDCRRENLVIAAKPPGGWAIPRVKMRKDFEKNSQIFQKRA